MKKICILSLILVPLIHARQIRIITPYAGVVHNQLVVQHMTTKYETMMPHIDDLEDDALMGGLYFQWVNPDRYQWNIFVYGSKNINYSDILGSHIIFDYYLDRLPVTGQFVFGVGFDYIRINTKGEISTKLSDFHIPLNVYAPYFRTGCYFNFGSPTKKVSILPWAGYEQDVIRGDVSFLVKEMAIQVNRKIKSDYEYAMIGLNARVTLFYFIDISAKWSRKISLDDHDHLNTFSGMFNLYLSRHWGLSYRYKYLEVSVCNNGYHLGGVVFMF
ncbi:hypothetical protein JW835_10335 [bacterium]|nr:hypothetical protein [bacterium]